LILLFVYLLRAFVILCFYVIWTMLPHLIYRRLKLNVDTHYWLWDLFCCTAFSAAWGLWWCPV